VTNGTKTFLWAILVAFYGMRIAKQWWHSYAQHHMGLQKCISIKLTIANEQQKCTLTNNKYILNKKIWHSGISKDLCFPKQYSFIFYCLKNKVIKTKFIPNYLF